MTPWIRRALVAGLGLYTLAGTLKPERFWVIHAADLIFHESGHPVFGLLGHWMGMAGGTLMQLLLPFGIAVAFWRQGQRYSAAIMGWWFGQNFAHIAPYVRDARTQELPLVGGGVHDWHYLLGSVGLLAWDQALGNALDALAVILMMSALYFAWFWASDKT